MAPNFKPFKQSEIKQTMVNRHTIREENPNPPVGLKTRIYRFSKAWNNYQNS